VAKTRDPEKVKRNDMMFAQWRRGASITSVAAENGIARQVAARIIASYHPEDDEDTDRALFRGELWRLHDEVAEIFHNPGYKMAPTGSPAHGPDGEPAEDTNVKVQAGELRLKVLDRLLKVDARDRVQPKIMTVQFDVARQKMAEDLAVKRAELEYLARRAVLPPTVPGEVIAELEAGGGEDQQRGKDGG